MSSKKTSASTPDTLAESVPETQAEPVVEAPAVPTLAPARAHHTYCTVVGSMVASENKYFSPGDVHDFPDSDVLSLPDLLIPL